MTFKIICNSYWIDFVIVLLNFKVDRPINKNIEYLNYCRCNKKLNHRIGLEVIGPNSFQKVGRQKIF